MQDSLEPFQILQNPGSDPKTETEETPQATLLTGRTEQSEFTPCVSYLGIGKEEQQRSSFPNRAELNIILVFSPHELWMEKHELTGGNSPELQNTD